MIYFSSSIYAGCFILIPLRSFLHLLDELNHLHVSFHSLFSNLLIIILFCCDWICLKTLCLSNKRKHYQKAWMLKLWILMNETGWWLGLLINQHKGSLLETGGFNVLPWSIAFGITYVEMAKMSWLNYLLGLSLPAGAKEVDCSWVRIRVQVTWSSCIFKSKEKSVIYDVHNLYIAALVGKIWAVLGKITALSKLHQVHLPFQTYSHELHASDATGLLVMTYFLLVSVILHQKEQNMLHMEYGKMRIAAISIWVATKHLLLFHTFCFRLSNGAKENPTYSYRECKA